uniref:Membrane protein n=1 Tax=Pantoea phage Survivor TaxID=3232176 RepID=A0AAU8KXV7_9CAUD
MKTLPVVLLILSVSLSSAVSVGIYKAFPKSYTISFSTEHYKVHEKYPELLAYNCTMTNEKLTSKKWEDGEYVERERTLYICKDRTLWR